jgi:serine/threonine-protein kinase HipA
MSPNLVVLLGDDIAGVIDQVSGDRLRFTYSEAYRGRGDATPLSISMPLTVATHTDRVVAPWLAGLLPENDAVLARWGRQFHVSASSPFALLGSPVGEDCAGAVRFAHESDVDRLQQRDGDIEWLDERGVAARLRGLREDSTAWLGNDFAGQFSLAGAQAKTALHFDGGRWGLPFGSTPTTHILKPAIRGFDDHEINEHLCLEAAGRVGLPVVRSSVEQFGNERAIVITRYDRQPTSAGLRRIHQEDVCQALAIPPRRKYQNEGGPSAADVITLLRRVVAPTASGQAVQRFVDALIWNWVIGGTDAHAKNYSLLLASDGVRLAPLYDIASALPYGMHERRLKMAMKIGGDYDFYDVRDRWRRAGREWGLDGEELTSRALEISRAAPEALSLAASAPEVAALGRPGPALLVDAVARRSERLVRFLS